MHKNNFDFLRHLFALLVVVAHCFPLSGSGFCDWLCQITNNQFDLSQLGVKGFFIISGYLIFQSLERSDSLFDYYWKRILRLFPGLLVVLVLTICFLPLVYNGSLHDYFTNRSTLTYIPNNLILYKTQYIIPGVFENNPYKSIINGSLWTIPYEFTLYILLSLLFFFKTNRIFTKIVLSIAATFLITINLFFSSKLEGLNFILMSKHVVDLGFYFIAGSLLSVFKFNEFKYINPLLLITSVLIILSVYFDFFGLIKYLSLPIIVIGIGIKHFPLISKLTEKTGDLSYGIYIYGFLIQQILMHYFHLSFWGLLTGSLILVPIFAGFSWHLIEKKALSFKNYFKNKKKANP